MKTVFDDSKFYEWKMAKCRNREKRNTEEDITFHIFGSSLKVIDNENKY